MDRRLALLPFVAAAAIMFACGPRSHARGESPATAQSARRASAGARAGTLASLAKPGRTRRSPRGPAIDAALSIRTGREVRFALTVANTSDHRVELTFPDGRTRDFAVFDVSGREVWRWSRGRLFTQGMQNTLVAPGDSVVYEERWTPSAPGRYTLVAQLRSENYPVERRATFDVPAAPAAAQVASPLANQIATP